jgi:hypothetical protein
VNDPALFIVDRSDVLTNVWADDGYRSRELGHYYFGAKDWYSLINERRLDHLPSSYAASARTIEYGGCQVSRERC